MKLGPKRATRPVDRCRPRPSRLGARLVVVGALVVVMGLTSWSCAGMGPPDPRAELPRAIDDYHRHLTWGRYAEAAGYLPQDQRGHFLGLFEEIGDEIEYTEYEVGALDVNSVTQVANVTIRLSWYQVPEYTVRETQIRETWTFDEASEFWVLTERSSSEAIFSQPTVP